MHRGFSMRSGDDALAKVRLGALMFVLPGVIGGLAPLAPHPGEFDVALLCVPSVASVVIGAVLWRYQRAAPNWAFLPLLVVGLTFDGTGLLATHTTASMAPVF